jgi:hypothetical protein
MKLLRSYQGHNKANRREVPEFPTNVSTQTPSRSNFFPILEIVRSCDTILFETVQKNKNFERPHQSVPISNSNTHSYTFATSLTTSLMTSNREIDGLAAEAAAEELAAGYYDAEPGVNYVFEDSEGEDFEDYCKELVRNGELLKAAVAGCTRLEDKIPPSLFEGLTFRQSLLVGNVHSLPRFGAGRDISVISNGNDQDKKDYQRGVKAWATFIWVFFGIW